MLEIIFFVNINIHINRQKKSIRSRRIVKKITILGNCKKKIRFYRAIPISVGLFNSKIDQKKILIKNKLHELRSTKDLYFYAMI